MVADRGEEGEDSLADLLRGTIPLDEVLLGAFPPPKSIIRVAVIPLFPSPLKSQCPRFRILLLRTEPKFPISGIHELG